MTSREGHFRAVSASRNDGFFPQFPGRSDVAGPPSIISSRMTDIATEDGRDAEALRGPVDSRASGLISEQQSRPGTGTSSFRTPWAQPPLRRGLSGHRISTNGSAVSSSAGGQPKNSRSHVPSVTSHAFFHPMSSQKLQAQRAASRPSTRDTHRITQEEPASSEGGHRSNHSRVSSGNLARVAQKLKTDDNGLQRPELGATMATVMTGRNVVTASPTHEGHPASLAESARPQQSEPQSRQGDRSSMATDVNTGLMPNSDLALPGPAVTSTRSFRSSFLLPARQSSNSAGMNREVPGREKLDWTDSTPNLPTIRKQEETPVEKVMLKFGRTHEYFQGNTVFCAGGRLQNTRDRPVNLGTGSLVVLPSVLFFIFSAPWVWENISPALPIIYAYLLYICLSSFLHASGSNPGILPRNLHRFPPADEHLDPLPLAPPTTDWMLVKSSEKSAAAMEVPVKFCKTCNIWRPPRAHHCRLCDNCIETQDHHCVWLNNCVGRRNYRYFFTFVTSTSLLAAYLVGVSLAQLAIYAEQADVTFGDAIGHFRVPFAMAIYGLLAFIYPAALMGYHVFLMVRGETTREYLNSHKFLKKERYRPFAQPSPMRNLAAVLCRPRPPTYHRFRENVRPGDQRYGTRRVGTAGKPAGKPAESREGVEMHAVRPQSHFQGPVALQNETSSAARVSRA